MQIRRQDVPSIAMYVAWTIALVATGGAIFIGEVMGQTPCVLCWYQRIFMFPLALILGLACFKGDLGGAKYGLLVAVPGLLIAGWHTSLYFGLISQAIAPCSQGVSCTDANMTIWGAVPLPLLSTLSFTAIAALLLIALRKEKS
ncbi:disulfide bond formation protein B [Pelagibacterium halotolerans]|nr:disulfide bond formation protein B [Pelagibacterium halotolerans]QJR17504.1 disulfide bond formation protein B [Pelagibacterium halotolerans]SEA75734.1 disulfide bond formation protein DsbB [Pelagibacterium halotolerans]